MKHNILSILSVLALGLAMSSCSDDYVPDITGSGELKLSSLTVEVAGGETVVNRSSQDRAAVDVSNFIVKIYKGEEVVEQWTYSKTPELISLPVADYRLVVYSHEVEKAAWDAPYYEGELDFSIKQNAITDLGSVTCTFQSLKVTVVYTPALRAMMDSDVSVEVVANNEGHLVYTPDETRAGFFAVVEGSQSLVATFTGTVNGYYENFFKENITVDKGQHLILTFDVKTNDNEVPGEYGSVDVDTSAGGINVDFSYADETVSGNAAIDTDEVLTDVDRPGYEEPLQPEDPNPGDDPTPGVDPANTISFESATLSFDAPNNASSVGDARVLIHADNKVAHLFVNIWSSSDSFNASAGEMLPFDFDLAYPQPDEVTYAGLGFPVANGYKDDDFEVGPVIGQTDLVFDITTFVPLLAAFPGTHKFTITVEDQTGAKKSITLTFAA